LQKYFKDIPIYEWEDLDGKNLIIRVTEDNDYKLLCGYDPIDNVLYVLAEQISE
jgi:hypothetical protein